MKKEDIISVARRVIDGDERLSPKDFIVLFAQLLEQRKSSAEPELRILTDELVDVVIEFADVIYNNLMQNVMSYTQQEKDCVKVFVKYAKEVPELSVINWQKFI